MKYTVNTISKEEAILKSLDGKQTKTVPNTDKY